MLKRKGSRLPTWRLLCREEKQGRLSGPMGENVGPSPSLPGWVTCVRDSVSLCVKWAKNKEMYLACCLAHNTPPINTDLNQGALTGNCEHLSGAHGATGHGAQ